MSETVPLSFGTRGYFTERLRRLGDSPTGQAAFWFVGCLLVYHVNLRAITQVDTVPPTYAAWALVRHGSFDVRTLREDRELSKHVGRAIVELPDGRWVSKFPPGSTLLALPFVAPLAAVRAVPLSPGSMRNLGKFIAASYTAAAVAVFWLLCRRLGVGGALPATIMLALGTGFWSTAAQAIWPHGPAVFLLIAALALLIWNPFGPGPAHAAVAGLLLGLAVLTRPPTALCVLTSGAALLLAGQFRAAVAMTLGGLPTVAVLMAYRHIYSDPLESAGYDLLSLYATPWSVGLPGLLVSPSRGLLVFCPAAALAGLGVWALARPTSHPQLSAPPTPARAVDPTCDARPLLTGQQRLQLSAALLAAVAGGLIYARWFEWWGGWCYGPRFLLEAMPITALLAGLGWGHLPGRPGRAFGWALIAVSVAVQFLGVFGHPKREMESWNARRLLSVPVDQRAFFDWTDNQIADHADRLRRRFTALQE